MKIKRREVLTFLASVGAGVGIATVLRHFRPVGEDIGSAPFVEDILADPHAPRTGPANARLTIVAFSDYNCPICRRSYAAMQAVLAGRTDIRVIHKEWPALGPDSVVAARVALAAADQGIYGRLHDDLMRRATRIDDATLRQAVEAAGGDWTKVQAVLAADGDGIDRQIARNTTEAFGLGLQGVPAYLIGPTLIRGGLDERGFRKAIDAAKAG